MNFHVTVVSIFYKKMWKMIWQFCILAVCQFDPQNDLKVYIWLHPPNIIWGCLIFFYFYGQFRAITFSASKLTFKFFLNMFWGNVLCFFGFRTLSNCLYLCRISPQTFWTESVLVPFLLVVTITPSLLSRTEGDRGTAAAADGNGKNGKWEKKGFLSLSLSLFTFFCHDYTALWLQQATKKFFYRCHKGIFILP